MMRVYGTLEDCDPDDATDGERSRWYAALLIMAMRQTGRSPEDIARLVGTMHPAAARQLARFTEPK